MNIWDSNFGENFETITTIEELEEYLKQEGSRYFHIKDKYEFKDDPQGLLEGIFKDRKLNMTYTDINHPVIISNDSLFGNNFMSNLFFEKNKERIINASKEKFVKDLKEEEFLFIPDYIFSDEILHKIISENNNKNIYITVFSSRDDFCLSLTEEQIKIIKENLLDFRIEKKESIETISSNILINNYTKKDLQKDLITIYLPLTDEEINNFKYIKENAIIKLTNLTNEISEKEYYEQCKKIFDESQKQGLKLNYKINIDNREIARETNIFSERNQDVIITIENDLEEKTKEQYLREEQILELMIKDIRASDLSTYEKYLAAYNIVKQFKEYKENEDNKSDSRHISSILNNDYMVCVGYAKLFEELCTRLAIPCMGISVSVDLSYDEGLAEEEKQVDFESHARNIVKIDDDKYNIHGIYLADPTWDNYLKHDTYFECNMTFDRKKEAKRLEGLAEHDKIFDFHDFNEYNEKINSFINKKIAKNSSSLLMNQTYQEKEIEAYIDLYESIMKYLSKIDVKKYEYFKNKYEEIMQKISFKRDNELIQSKMMEFLTEYGNYIIPLVNKEVPIETTIKAATEVKRLSGYDEETIKKWEEETLEFFYKKEHIMYPYIYDYEHGEAILEDRIETKSR